MSKSSFVSVYNVIVVNHPYHDLWLHVVLDYEINGLARRPNGFSLGGEGHAHTDITKAFRRIAVDAVGGAATEPVAPLRFFSACVSYPLSAIKKMKGPRCTHMIKWVVQKKLHPVGEKNSEAKKLCHKKHYHSSMERTRRIEG